MFRCSDCGRPFTLPGNLARHRSSHNGACKVWAPRVVAAKHSYHDSPAAAAAAAATAAASAGVDDADTFSDADDEQPAPAAADVHSAALPTDSAWRLWCVMRSCNKGAGLAAGDAQELLHVLHAPDFDITEVSTGVLRMLCVCRVAPCPAGSAQRTPLPYGDSN